LDTNTVQGVKPSYLVALVRGLAKYGTHGYRNNMQALDWRTLAKEFKP
jgi:hypothetical protein